MTQNHNYNTPAEGTTNWHLPLNENFEFLDRDVPVRDNEDRLDQYTPTENAKFEATDTGRRFIGDGSQWEELPYAMDAAATADGVARPAEATLAAIDQAIASNDVVRLEPGVTYTGDTTISIDPRDRDVYVYAGGATLGYTGSEVAVQIAENYTSDYRGRVHWLGGSVYGPGQGTATGFRIQDSFGHELSPDRFDGWKWAIEIRNVDNWSEGNTIRNIEQVERCDRFVRFNSPEDLGFGDGTDSFRFTRIENVMGEVVSDRFIEMTPNSAVYNSRITNITGFLNAEGGSLITVAGSPSGLLITQPFMEVGDAGSGYLIEVDEPIDGGLTGVIGMWTLGGIEWTNVDSLEQYVGDATLI